MSNDSLISRLKGKDPAAYKELFTQFKDQVFTVALGFVPDKEDAEDISQEVFVEIFRSVEHFRADAQLSTWIYRITVNKSLELIRKRKRKKRFAFLESILPGEGPQIKDPSTLTHPGLRLENKEKAEQLYAAIERLSENQRIAFTLTQVEGMSYKEVCDTMGLTQGAIESLIFRARKNLQKYLKQMRD